MEVGEYIVATDAGLVDMVLSGDRWAFEHLFHRYGGSLRQLCLQRTGGNEDDANDLVQDVFVKAFVHLDSYDRRYAFGQWIYTIARNTFIDWVRKRRDDLSIERTRGEYVGQPVSPNPNPEENIVRAEQRIQFEQYLHVIPSKYRKLIELRFLRDLSYDEIAEQLELPLGTVKTRLHRARAILCSHILKSADL